MQNKKLNKIIRKFNIIYGTILVALFVASAALITILDYQNKVHVANSISNIVEEKLKNNDKRDVVKILSSAQIGDFKAISYYNSEGKRTVTFPASINPSFFNQSGLIEKLRNFTLDVDLYYDRDQKNKSGTLRFSINPFESILTTAFIWLFFIILLIPTARQYKKLIVKNFEKEANDSKADAVKEIVRQIRHDSRGAIQAIKAVIGSSSGLDELQLDILKSATQRLEVMMNDTKINKAQEVNSENNSQQKALSHIYTCVSDIIREKKILFKETQNISINVEYDVDVLKVFLPISETDINRILSNILDNSFHAIKQKGVEGKISIKLTSDGTVLEIEIEDNGIGIKPELMPNIGKKGYTLKSNGTGLGVSWAIQKIRKFGGNFIINSQYGSWTRVTISLPLETSKLFGTNSLDLRGINTVVAIDDDPSVIKTWKDKILKNSEYSLGFFNYESGEHYFEDPQNDEKTLFLLDYDLGQGNFTGTQIASRIENKDHVYLVSNNFDDWEIQDFCSKQNIKLIPKTIINEIEVRHV